jgi:uroporphyrinogen decarboxylase
VDRIPIYDSFWDQTREDFHQQGVPREIQLEDHFGFDFGMFWFEQSFLLPEETVSQEGNTRTFRDQWGTLFQDLVDAQTTPGLLDFALKDRDDWEDNYKGLLTYQSSRIDWDAIKASWAMIREKQKYGVLSMLGPFECTWHMVGPEQQLMMMVMDPDWLTDLYDVSTTLIEDGWQDLIRQGIKPDGLWLYEDIGFRSGLLFSPQHYRELLKPFHKRLAELAHSSGAELIYHSDGNIHAAIPDLIDLGVDCLHPMEVKAGMDVRELKKEFGDQITLMGNIDARLYQSNDREGLDAEIREKLAAAMAGGGYIYHSDHSIPPGARLDTYTYGLDVVREVGRY